MLVRQVPRHLSVKVRRYYEYYYTQAAVFEEAEILDPLPPILHNDVVSFVTQVTLLKVPLFKRLDPTIYKYILPLLKPLRLNKPPLPLLLKHLLLWILFLRNLLKNPLMRRVLRLRTLIWS